MLPYKILNIPNNYNNYILMSYRHQLKKHGTYIYLMTFAS